MSLVGFKARNHPQQSAKPHVDDRQTPPELFDPLHRRYRFTLDAAASRHNAKLTRYSPRRATTPIGGREVTNDHGWYEMTWQWAASTMVSYRCAQCWATMSRAQTAPAAVERGPIVPPAEAICAGCGKRPDA